MIDLNKLEKMANETVDLRMKISAQEASGKVDSGLVYDERVKYLILVDYLQDVLPELKARHDLSAPLEDKLKALIREHEDKLHYGYGSDDLVEVVRHLFRAYERNAETAIEDAQRFQGDMVLWFQGLALCCQMVANGATHTEKNARMRGLVEMIESALAKVREYDYRLDHFNRNSYRPEHLFVNDYPVRHWKDRADSAERELKEFKDKLSLAPKPENANGDEGPTDFLAR